MAQLRSLAVPDTRPLFVPLRAGLLSLLRSLEPADWDRPTIAGAWRVRDVAAHLFDGEVRTLAAHRDGHTLAAGGDVRSYDDIVALIDGLNAEGVAAGKHLSSRLITDLLAVTGEWMHAFVAALDPDAPARFAVAWAGETESTNRFDTAREYTERWHHEMQIRLALGVPGHSEWLLEERFVAPLIETAVRVLPHAYRQFPAADGLTVVLGIEASNWGRAYTLRREARAWQLYAGEAPEPTARVAGSADAWWRLFFNALPSADMTRAFAATGMPALLAPLWRARSVMV